MYKFCIAEDEYYVQKSIMGRIQALKLDLTCAGCASTGEEAEALYDREKPDLFFVDISMPQNDGITFIGNVRKKDPESRTLFIIISGYSDYQSMHRAIKVDVFDYLQKPIVPQEFAVMMYRAVEALEAMEAADNSGWTDETADAGESTDDGNESRISQVCEYIQTHYAEDINAKTIGEVFFLSASYLAHVFRSHTGTSIGKYLEDVRLAQAEKLLLDTDLQISQIAERVGYHDSNYFTKCFRKKYQISPSEIKKKSGSRSK